MGVEHPNRDRRQPGLSSLKWAAILLPLTFLAVVDLLRQTMFDDQAYVLPGLPGLAITYVILVVSVYLFANSVFGLVERLQRRNDELFEQSQLRNRELQALLTFDKTMSAYLTTDELMTRSLDTIIEVTSAEGAEVWLWDGEDEIEMRQYRGPNAEAFLERTRFQIGEGVPGIVAERRESVLVRDLPDDSRFVRHAIIEAGFKTFCALPLTVQDKLVGVLAVASRSRDAFTERREFDLMESIGERLALALENSRLYEQLQDAATVQERERIAREMHDGMAQLLGYINTQTIAVNKLMSDGRHREAREQLAKMQNISGDLYTDVREGILGLRTASLRTAGLIPSLEEYTHQYMEMSDIDVRMDVPAGVREARLPPSAEIQLIRIVQEALTNVRKHARATSVELRFSSGPEAYNVAIVDNGRGIRAGRSSRNGRPRFGLQTMRERAESIGGEFSIESGDGAGTTVAVRVPIIQSSYTVEE